MLGIFKVAPDVTWTLKKMVYLHFSMATLYTFVRKSVITAYDTSCGGLIVLYINQGQPCCLHSGPYFILILGVMQGCLGPTHGS
jgi:hypothetical protein